MLPVKNVVDARLRILPHHVQLFARVFVLGARPERARLQHKTQVIKKSDTRNRMQSELTQEAVQVGVSSRSAAWPFASDEDARTKISSRAALTPIAGAGDVPFWISDLKHVTDQCLSCPFAFWCCWHHLFHFTLTRAELRHPQL